MDSADIDWTYLGRGLVVPVAVCAVALVALGASSWARGRYAEESGVQEQQLAALEQQRVELSNRLEARRRYRARFVELEAAGVVGDEQRLGWAQVMRDSARELRLPYLRYSAVPRQTYGAEDAVALPVPVMATTMDIQAGLVHEGDLLRLFTKLREEAPGLLAVNGCVMERVAGDGEPGPDKANVAATCQLRWFSIPIAMTVAESGS